MDGWMDACLECIGFLRLVTMNWTGLDDDGEGFKVFNENINV